MSVIQFLIITKKRVMCGLSFLRTYSGPVNLRTSRTLPVAQIQIFVHGDLDERSDKAIKVEATPGKRRRIKVITHAKKLLSDCYGERSNKMTDEHPTDNAQSTANSSPENNDSVREGVE
ncbi:hypothetical protein FIE12Z_12876 [Fusarium flagelliforme]|uniref:Uncharacterized protein n=1 Tax=Fusarium flagelliforme TaxID=2675880 RepID=A0A395M4U3_9HYPO|nr:hypothetical protein FIE12Z_12876 [Fusarium flagelliforme]